MSKSGKNGNGYMSRAKRAQRRDAILRDVKAEMTVVEIAAKYGISRARVYQIIEMKGKR